MLEVYFFFALKFFCVNMLIKKNIESCNKMKQLLKADERKNHTHAYYLIDSLNDKKEEMKKHKQYY